MVSEIRDLTGETASEISGLTRAAYAAGDLVPGLPTADGALAGPEEVRSDLLAGARLWVAAAGGRLVGAVRGIRGDDGAWEVRRLAVAPWYRRGGTARTLLRRLEEEGFAAGADRVVLDAVVERGNPAFYARVGYTAVRHFGAEDKPLSEVRMERTPDAPERGACSAPDGRGTAVFWWSVGGRTLCAVTPVARAPLPGTGRPAPLGYAEAVPVGADFRRGAADTAALLDSLAGGAVLREGDALVFDSPVHDLTAFRQPRLVHPDLLARWRDPSVRLLQRA